MRDALAIPLTITVILVFIIATAVVYIFDMSGNPIWNTPELIPLILVIPLIMVGWLPLGFCGIYLNRRGSSGGIILIVISIMWILALLIAIVSFTQSLIHLL